MPRKKQPAKARSAERKTAGDLHGVKFRIQPEVPMGEPSQYCNHVTVQRRRGAGATDEVTVTFWQIPLYAVDAAAETVPAVFLGSYVMSKDFADTVLAVLADQLDTPEGVEETDGD